MASVFSIFYGWDEVKRLAYTLDNIHVSMLFSQIILAGALGWPRGMGRGGRWEGRSGWGTHVNPWLIHVSVWQKPLQYCKVISLQLIKIIGRKKKKEISLQSWSQMTRLGPKLVFPSSILASLSTMPSHLWSDSLLPERNCTLLFLPNRSPHFPVTCMCAKSLKSYPTLCDPTDCSPPGSSVHGIPQARILVRVAISSSRGSSQPRDRTNVS